MHTIGDDVIWDRGLPVMVVILPRTIVVATAGISPAWVEAIREITDWYYSLS
jgi:hypothetical protein